MSIDKIIASVPAASREKRKGMRRNALEKLEGDNSNWHADAQKLLAALQTCEATEQAELIADLEGMEPAERVIRAFTAEPMTETEEKLVRVLLDNPGSSTTELAENMGWKGMSWHLHFGTMCANRGIYLGPPEPASLPSGKYYSGILADFDNDGSRFTMKPEVAAAFEKLALRRRG